MPRQRLTQKDIIKRILSKDPKKRWDCGSIMGEHKIGEEWFFVSYKAQSRLTELFQEGLVNRVKVMGRSGREYYVYWDKVNQSQLSMAI